MQILPNNDPFGSGSWAIFAVQKMKARLEGLMMPLSPLTNVNVELAHRPDFSERDLTSGTSVLRGVRARFMGLSGGQASAVGLQSKRAQLCVKIAEPSGTLQSSFGGY